MNVLIAGYFGFGNAGDEWLLSKTVALLRDKYPLARLCVLYQAGSPKEGLSSNAPFQNSDILGEITYCFRGSLISMIQSFLRMDQLVFGGGGVFQDSTSLRSLLYYTSLVWLSRLLGKKVVCLSQGIGPLSRPFSRWLMKKTLQKIDFVSTRDTDSYQELVLLNATPQRIAIVPDMAYYKSVIKTGDSGQKPPLLGLSLRPFPQICSMASSFSQFMLGNDHDFIFLDCHANVDYPVLAYFSDIERKLVDWVNLHALFTHQIQETALDRYRLMMMIGMRYHSCVYASLLGIPFLGLAYDPKVRQLALMLGQEWLDVTDPSLTVDTYKVAYDKIMNRYETYQDILVQKTQSMIQDAQKNAQFV